MNRNVSLLLLLLLLAGIAVAPGCGTFAPKYTQPKAPVPADWPRGAAYQKTQAVMSAPEVPNLEWREFITDAKLQQVIETALTNNRDLRVAALNAEQAQARYGIQRSELFPIVNAVGSASKQRIPGRVMGFPESLTIERYDVNLGISSWELDFFGRIRSMKEAALQQYFATEEARRATQILLVSEVARAYYTLAADQENLKLAETTLATQQEMYDLVKRRFDRGVVAELDVYRAQTQVDAARGDVARFTQLVAQDENILNFLVGTPVPDDLLPLDLGCVVPPKEISPGISSDVLLHRPDVLQAENLLKAANANIGAARAALFPRISLTAGVGTASTDLSGLFDAGTGTWSYAPQIVLPIFDSRLWFAAKLSKVNKKLAIAQYENVIQNAFREVADALAVRGTADQQVASQESLVSAVEETYRLSNARYTKGKDSYLSVLDAQRSLYAAQQGLVFQCLAKIANQVRLYAVLGGGWK